jgi:hypothetical protein
MICLVRLVLSGNSLRVLRALMAFAGRAGLRMRDLAGCDFRASAVAIAGWCVCSGACLLS